MSDFYQSPPRIGNQYDQDRLLRSYLRRVLPAETLAEVEPDLRRLGARAAGDEGAGPRQRRQHLLAQRRQRADRMDDEMRRLRRQWRGQAQEHQGLPDYAG